MSDQEQPFRTSSEMAPTGVSDEDEAHAAKKAVDPAGILNPGVLIDP